MQAEKMDFSNQELHPKTPARKTPESNDRHGTAAELAYIDTIGLYSPQTKGVISRREMLSLYRTALLKRNTWPRAMDRIRIFSHLDNAIQVESGVKHNAE